MSIRRPRHQHLPSHSGSFSEPSSPFRALDSPDPFLTARADRDANNLSTRKSATSPKAIFKQLKYLLRIANAGKGTFVALGLICTVFVYALWPGKTDKRTSWAALLKQNDRGWLGFDPSPHLKTPVEEPTLSTAQRLSYACLDEWVAKGTLCDEEVNKGGFKDLDHVDALYTWVNGSDPILNMWYQDTMGKLGYVSGPGVQVQRKRGPGKRGLGNRGRNKSVKKHFREHDELRFSFRSLLSAFEPTALSSIHLITADLPSYKFPTSWSKSRTNTAHDSSLDLTKPRIGQSPVWLNPNSLTSAKPPLKLVHHSDIFTDASALPTFNSKGIESQLGNMHGITEHSVYLNDDNFLGLKGEGSFVAADFGSPLLGPVIRLQTTLLVDAIGPTDKAGDTDSEWPGLKRANWLLNRRFGYRRRAYIAHIAKSVSIPIYREASTVWKEEFDQTAASRFRGHQIEYNPFFASTHYLVERHREALLWSFFVAKSDKNLDGILSHDERRALLAALGMPLMAAPEEALSASLPERATLDGLASLYGRASLRAPRSTEIVFDSRDGFALAHGPPSYDTLGRSGGEVDAAAGGWPVIRQSFREHALQQQRAARETCAFAVDECLGDGFGGADGDAPFGTNEVFRRVAFENPKCGDCAILLLVKASGEAGLEAFLPPAGAAPKEDHPKFEPLSMAKDYAEVDFVKLAKEMGHTHLRERAVRLIARYGYSIGDSVSSFVLMKGKKTLLPQLARLNKDFARTHGLSKVSVLEPALLTLNDDMGSDMVSQSVEGVIKGFFEAVWKLPTRFERLE